MNARIRLVVSDIDGTLVRDDKSMSDRVAAAVGRLQAVGVGFSLISARPPSGIVGLAEKLGITGTVGAFNGGTLVEPNGVIASAAWLEPACAALALSLIDQDGVEPWLFADGLWYTRTADHPRVAREKLSAQIEPTLCRDFSELMQRVDKLVGVSENHVLLRTLEGEVAAALGGSATVARSQPYFLDITARGANKGDGLAALAKAHGVAICDVAVLGDQYNDLPMFARAGLSIAMGQAPAQVRAAADLVVSSNEKDGASDAIDRLILTVMARLKT